MRTTIHSSRYLCAFIMLLSLSNMVFALDIIKKKNDEREFKFLTLENQLKVLLVSDQDAPKSAASLNINAGSGEDPDDRYGLSHFLEHMLFLGSKKFPKANELDAFISGHAGSHNAFTSLLNTNYFFDIESSQFEGGIDRFSSMFIAPILSEKYIEREVNAVHSEFSSRFTNDFRRARDVFRDVVIDKHPLSKFSTGNIETLNINSPRPLVDDVRSFYEKYYQATNMALVLYGPQSLKELSLLAKRYFTEIPNNKSVDHQTFSSIFPPDLLPAKISVKPNKEIRTLSLIFPMPYSDDYIEEKPVVYLGHLLGHEGKGSLFSVLKEKGWATALSAGKRFDWRGGEVFSIEVQLTPKGLAFEQQIENLFFHYLELVKSEGVDEWRFNELKNLGIIGFEYGEPIDPVRQVIWLSSRLHRIDPELLLYEPYVYEKFDVKLIQQFSSYINKDNLLKVLMAPEVVTDKKSEFYETPYKINKKNLIANVNSLDELEQLKLSLSLPQKNRFIPDDFEIYESITKAQQSKPKEIVKTKTLSAWFANDNTFDLPKVSLKSRYILPMVAQSPESFAAMQIFTRIIRESLNEAVYDATVGGLRYSLGANYRGLNINFEGYNDTISILMQSVVDQIRNYLDNPNTQKKINDEFFARVKEDLERKANNSLKENPSSQIFRDLPSVIYRPYWSAIDVKNAYEKMTLKDYKKFVREMFNGGSAEVFLFGNLKETQAKKLVKDFSRVMKDKTKKVESVEGRVVKLGSNPINLVREVSTEESDNALVIYYQGQSDSYADRAVIMTLQQMLSTPFFNRLRTEKQLGYIVYSANYSFKDTPGFLTVIQSPDRSVQEIYDTVKQFFALEKQTIFENFSRDKASIILSLEEKPTNQKELSDRFWSQILMQQVDFNEREKLIAALQQTTREDVEKAYQNILIEGRRNIVFASSSKDSLKLENMQLIDDEKSFKRQANYYAYP